MNAALEQNPTNYSEAICSNKRDGWVKAMEEEVESLQKNKVWKVVKRAPGSNALHTKWVFKTKTDAQGKITRLKARLVACGNEQVLGVDYSHAFAAVMDLSIVKIILVLDTTWGVPSTATSPTRMSRQTRRGTYKFIYMCRAG